jgi:urease accessory protein
MIGTAEVGFLRDRNGRTRLATLSQRSPLRVLFPESGGTIPEAVLLTTSGGLAGGDRLEIGISAGSGAAAMATTQAAEKVYRSTGSETTVRVRLIVGDGGWLEWAPQETILFEGARLRRLTELSLADTAAAMMGEIVVLGRIARGERFSTGLLHDGIEVRRGGRLTWVDAFRLDRDIAATIAKPACLDDAVAVGTLLYAASDVSERLPAARALAVSLRRDGLRIAVTVVGSVLLTRFLAKDALALRRAFAAYSTCPLPCPCHGCLVPLRRRQERSLHKTSRSAERP